MRTKVLFSLVAAVALAIVHSQTIWADGDEDRNPNWRRPHVETKVESRSDGVWIQIEVRQTVAGVALSPPSGAPPGPPRSSGTTAVTSPVGSHASAGRGSSASQAVSSGRSWYDPVRGYFHESPDGHLTHLTMPNIGNASAAQWREEFRRRPNQTPWLVYYDGQLVDIIWLSSQTNPNSVRFGTPPANTLPQASAPTAGVSIDPRQVALDAFEHVPLPNIQIRMNPSLGLVALPGWFWVEGYNGQSFGTSRTVEVPPAVGAEVPVDIVPADDPRRRGSSFTVEVRVWASKYEWSFGDGASLVTRSLGKPYPAESDIQHTYEYSSRRFPSGFPVRLTVEYSAEYRVNGGAPQPLPPIRRTYEAGYRVQEVQPVLTNR